ncbi:MAG: phosphatase PAP2 family protein [Janthinobacterium lividum]
MFYFLTNGINTVLILLVAAAPLLPQPKRRNNGAIEFWLRSLLGIGIGVVLAETGKRIVLWPGHPSFPSGHETLALAAGVCLVVRSPRWAAAAVPIAALQAWALVAGHFHRPIDIAGALITGILPPLGCHLWKRSSAS